MSCCDAPVAGRGRIGQRGSHAAWGSFSDAFLGIWANNITILNNACFMSNLKIIIIIRLIIKKDSSKLYPKFYAFHALAAGTGPKLIYFYRKKHFNNLEKKSLSHHQNFLMK